MSLRIWPLLVALLALPVSAAEIIVIESSDPALETGSVLDDSQTITVPAGKQVIFANEAGQEALLNGPFTGQVDFSGSQAVQGSSGANLGATRSIAATKSAVVQARPSWPMTVYLGRPTIPVGGMHGFSPGALFAITTEKNGLPIGYARIESTDLFNSELRPVAANGLRKLRATKIPEIAYAELVEAAPVPELVIAPIQGNSSRHNVKAIFEELGTTRTDSFRLVVDAKRADIQPVIEDERLWLVPKDRPLIKEGPGKTLSIDLAQREAYVSGYLMSRLYRMARAMHFLKLAEGHEARMGYPKGARAENSVQLNISIQRAGEDEARPIGNKLVTFRNGDTIKFQVFNNTPRSIDATLIFIDSQYRMQSLFPGGPKDKNRIDPRKDLSFSGQVSTAETAGLEAAILISSDVRGKGRMKRFGFLAGRFFPLNKTLKTPTSLQASRWVTEP